MHDTDASAVFLERMQNDQISGSVRVPTIEFRASLSNECKVHGLLHVALALLMDVGMVQVRSFAPSVVQETWHASMAQ